MSPVKPCPTTLLLCFALSLLLLGLEASVNHKSICFFFLFLKISFVLFKGYREFGAWQGKQKRQESSYKCYHTMHTWVFSDTFTHSSSISMAELLHWAAAAPWQCPWLDALRMRFAPFHPYNMLTCMCPKACGLSSIHMFIQSFISFVSCEPNMRGGEP